MVDWVDNDTIQSMMIVIMIMMNVVMKIMNIMMIMMIKKALLALGKPWETGVTILPVLHLSAYQEVIPMLNRLSFNIVQVS